MLRKEVDCFLKEVVNELNEENLAIFAGAGLSVGAGYVNWADLLRPIADEIGLDVDKENDLVALAQYHCNENGNNRSQLNRRIIEEFSENTELTENHRILSRLPIKTYWTTNYDKMIEQSLLSIGKIPDVKYTTDQLIFTKPRRDAIIYKMHGDVEHPDNAILTKDDYEKYYLKMDPFVSALKGDLISKTFIFIGFSFTDPNIDYILSRVRVNYERNQRRHYCLLKKIERKDSEKDADFEYRVRKQELFINDLNRFNIKTILVDDFKDITSLLEKIESLFKNKTIFISGAAHDYGNIGEHDSLKFIYNFSSKLVSNRFSIVSGFGLGVGSSVISGALEQIYLKGNQMLKDQLILRPFPQKSTFKTDLKKLWREYREDMISHAGIAIFLFGNKQKDGETILSDGMEEEYKIAKEKDLIIIPVGATGFMAKKLWEKEILAIKNEKKMSGKGLKLLEKIGDERLTCDEISEVLFDIIKLYTK